ncbi:MAG: purine-nucleoside phosphorylase [bacterium]|nr:purine-nucleoside phosphorylase [bacterium]
MTDLKKSIENAVQAIRTRSTVIPELAIILGTGLGGLVNEIEIEVEIPYEEIPGFPLSTVEFHAGKLIIGTLSGKKVVAMQGRFHMYEGYDMKQITFPVRVLKHLGADTLIISNACGGINADFSKGDLMAIKDHINLLCDNPLIGANDNSIGPRFPDMSEPYNKEMISLAIEIAKEENIRLQTGVYASMSGPSLETAAEYNMLRVIGADAIGMSTVPEVIVGVHMRMKILAFSVVTDICVPETLEAVNIDEIIKIANEAEPKLTMLIKKVVERL